jgi:basic membrane protein A
MRRLARMAAAVLACGCLGAAASSCGGDDDGNGGGASGGDTLKVGLVFEGPLDDGGWNSIWKQGGEKLKADVPGTEVTYVANTTHGAQAQRAFRGLATQGYDLIVGTASGHDVDLLKVVDDFPDSHFAAFLGQKTRPNLARVDAAIEQGRYLDGVVAGSMAGNGKIGQILGYPVPYLLRGVDAFGLGVKSVNPDATQDILTINSWHDPAKEHQAAEALADSGVDVLASNTNTPSVPAVAKARDINLIGQVASKEDSAPDQWLSGFTYDFSKFLVKSVKDLRGGAWKPDLYYGDLSNGTIDMLPFGSSVPQSVIDKVERAREQLVSGDLVIFRGPIKSNEGEMVVPAGDALREPDQLVKCCEWLIEDARGQITNGQG